MGPPPGSQVLSANPLQQELLTGSTPSLGTSICSITGSFIGCRWISASAGAAGAQPPHHGLHHRLHENLLCCLDHLHTLLPHWPGCLHGYFLTYSHSSLFCLQLPQQGNFFPFLKYVIPEALPILLMGSALATSRSIVLTSGIGFVGHGGNFKQLLWAPATKNFT